MEIISLPSAVAKKRKVERQKMQKQNKHAYRTLKEQLVPSELTLSDFRRYYHSVLSVKEKQVLIGMGIDPWSVEGLKYAGDCKRYKIKLGCKIEKDQ